MSKIDICFAELHNSLFHAGKNFGLKLDPTKLTGLGLVYDRAEKELLVSWQGKTAIVPAGNIGSMTEGKVEARIQVAPPSQVGIKGAQVETPMSHVHAGQGHGKVGKEK